MTNTEKTLAAVYGIIGTLYAEEQNAIHAFVEKGEKSPDKNLATVRIANLVLDLQAQILAECYKSMGKGKELAAAKRICKQGDYSGAVYMDGAKQGIMGDWHYCVVLNQAFADLPGIRKRTPEAVKNSIEKSMKLGIESVNMEIELPEVAELKAHIKTKKAASKGSEDRRVVWDFGERMPLVNADSLLNILELLPGCKAKYKQDNENSGIYFVAEAGEAYLLPIHKAHYAAQKAV